MTEAPMIGTGMEYKAACDSGVVILCKEAGTVEFVDAETILIRRDSDDGVDQYDLLKFKRSNQGTCVNQRPIVSITASMWKREKSLLTDLPPTWARSHWARTFSSAS